MSNISAILWREQVTFNVIDYDVHFVIAPKTLNYFAFQSFNFECTWWSLFQKRNKFDIYVFICCTRL